MILIRRGEKIPPDFFIMHNVELRINYQSNYELNFKL